LIIGDHGMRYGKSAYQTYGTYEHRLPALFLVAPLSSVRGKAKLNLEINQQRLVTVWDIYETLKDFPLPYLRVPRTPTRRSKTGLSMQSEIPAGRTCQHAGIPLELCQCNRVAKRVAITNRRLVISRILGKIRAYARDKVGLCHRMHHSHFRIKNSEKLAFTHSTAKSHSMVNRDNSGRLRVTIESTDDPVLGKKSELLSFMAYLSADGHVHSVSRASAYNHEKCSSEADEHGVDIEFCVCKDGNSFPLPAATTSELRLRRRGRRSKSHGK